MDGRSTKQCNYNSMNDRILESNNLYQRIEHKNIFKTLSKAYNRSFRARPKGEPDRFQKVAQEQAYSKTLSLNSHVYATLYSNQGSTFNLDRNEFLESFAFKNGTQHSTKMLNGLLHQHSKTMTLPLQRTGTQDGRQFARNCNTTLGSSTNASEPLLMKTYLRRNHEFKLKSCQKQQQPTYQGPIDQTDFSTLELRKRLSVGSQKQGRYQNWRSTMRSAGKNNKLKGKTSKTAFQFTKYPKETDEDLKNHLQMISKRRT